MYFHFELKWWSKKIIATRLNKKANVIWYLIILQINALSKLNLNNEDKNKMVRNAHNNFKGMKSTNILDMQQDQNANHQWQ